MRLLYMTSLAIVIWTYIATNVDAQLMTRDQKNVIEAQTDQRFLFETNFVREDECQCGQLLRRSDEWIATCRLCFDASLASTLFIKVAMDKKVVISWKTSDNQGCTFSEYGKTRFTTNIYNKKLQNNLIYLQFRMKPTDPNAMYHNVMCGAEAVDSSNKKAYFSKWGDGEICYRESNDTDNSILEPSVDATTVSTPNGEFAVISSANLSLDDTDAGTSTEKNEAFLDMTYRQLAICGIVFVVALLFICISGVAVVVKRRGSSERNRLLRKESKVPIVDDSSRHEVTACSEYEQLKKRHNDCVAYAVLSNEKLTESEDLSANSRHVDATELNTGNLPIYQHLSYSAYCHLNDYESIDPDNACYAQPAV